MNFDKQLSNDECTPDRHEIQRLEIKQITTDTPWATLLSLNVSDECRDILLLGVGTPY